MKQFIRSSSQQLLLGLSFAVCIAPSIGLCQPRQLTIKPLPANAVTLSDRWKHILRPTAQTKIAKAAKALNDKVASEIKLSRNSTAGNIDVLTDAQNASASQFPATLPDGQGNIALVFLVLMDAGKSAQEDLNSIMAGVKAINNQKSALRQIQEKMQHDEAGFGKKKDSLSSIKKQEAQAQAKLDSLDDLSQQQQLKLQMAMERYEQFINALSNIMKKVSATSDAIISNMK